MHRARLTCQAQNSHPSCRGRRPRRPVNSIKNAASGGVFTLSRGAERPNCDRPRSGHLSGRTRAPKASGRGGRGRNVGASGTSPKAFFFGAPPRFFGQDQRNGVERAGLSTNTQQRIGEFRRGHMPGCGRQGPSAKGETPGEGSPFDPLLRFFEHGAFRALRRAARGAAPGPRPLFCKKAGQKTFTLGAAGAKKARRKFRPGLGAIYCSYTF